MIASIYMSFLDVVVVDRSSFDCSPYYLFPAPDGPVSNSVEYLRTDTEFEPDRFHVF